ncbi:MAG TPA: LysR substrate-binding domain-containing protein [Labilithrix sp.]
MKRAPHPVTLRQLQYVVAVADHASFRRAAEACAVAQPSLSSQVAQVEEALGVTIFERLPSGVVVTEAGARIVERARRVIVDADDLVATAEEARDPLAGTLRVGVIPTVAPYLLPIAAGPLRDGLPRLQFLWFEERTRELVVRIEAGELDAGVLAEESDLDDLEHETLAVDPFVLAVAKTHPLAKAKGPARLEDLEGETVLLLDDGHCFRDQALAVCNRAAAAEASVRATSLSTLAQMAAGGVGVTLLPELAVETENRARGLVTRAFGPRGPSRTLVLAWRPTSPKRAALHAAADVLRAIAKKR